MCAGLGPEASDRQPTVNVLQPTLFAVGLILPVRQYTRRSSHFSAKKAPYPTPPTPPLSGQIKVQKIERLSMAPNHDDEKLERSKGRHWRRAAQAAFWRLLQLACQTDLGGGGGGLSWPENYGKPLATSRPSCISLLLAAKWLAELILPPTVRAAWRPPDLANAERRMVAVSAMFALVSRRQRKAPKS